MSRGLLYFATDTQAIKVGSTVADIGSRLGAVQTGNPRKIILIATLPDAGREHEVLSLFLPDWIRGEWFFPSRKVISWIRANANVVDGFSFDIFEGVKREDFGPPEGDASRGSFRRWRVPGMKKIKYGVSEQIRLKHGGITAAARKVGMNCTRLAAILNSGAYAAPDEIEKIAVLLGVTTSEIIKDANNSVYQKGSK